MPLLYDPMAKYKCLDCGKTIFIGDFHRDCVGDVSTCEACDNTDEDFPLCEGCGCCQECCNCTDTDCDCYSCEDKRSNEI